MRPDQADQVRNCWDCREHGERFNGNWRGGRTKHEAGYLMIRLPEHPRAHGYVFEHIGVMDDFLGRRLLPDEQVHHRNVVRHDNRIENLELWIRPQPSGIRVEDAVRWADDPRTEWRPVATPNKAQAGA